MANEKKSFDAAMRKLAEEVRKGVAKTRPMTPEQRKAIEVALELQHVAPAAGKPKQERMKKRIERRRRPGHDIEI